MSEREDRIRTRAHELWIAAGRPDGREKDHWQQAEREIDGGKSEPVENLDTTNVPETAATFAPIPPKKPARKKS